MIDDCRLMIEGILSRLPRLSSRWQAGNFITKRQGEAIPQIDNHQSTVINFFSKH
jgi:hypothetical protein